MTISKRVPLRKLLQRANHIGIIDPLKTYSEITVRLWGKGVVKRSTALGSTLQATARYTAKTGQFIYSRIDARNGATGIIPPELCDAVVTGDFPLFDCDLESVRPAYLGYFTKSEGFIEACRRGSDGTTNRKRFEEQKLLDIAIPLPPLPEQDRVVRLLSAVEERAAQIVKFNQSTIIEGRRLLLFRFNQLCEEAEPHAMRCVAPIIRRSIKVEPDVMYAELGIRSFGKGTFHKPSLSGAEIGTKRIFTIMPGDLLFSNVFAWEGAIAIALDEDRERVGSHRFMTCVVNEAIVRKEYLLFYFLAPVGLSAIRHASPGGAGRNKTLGVDKLLDIVVSVPSTDLQDHLIRLNREYQAANEQIEKMHELNVELQSALLKQEFAGIVAAEE